MRDADVIVIGAGIVGAACAHELARNGLDVCVIDARFAAATAAGMGHLVVMDDDAAELALSRESLRLWHEWAPRLDQGSAFERCGTLWVAADDDEMSAAAAKQRRLLGVGVECELIDAAALARAEPALRRGLAGALRVGGDSIVYAPSAARWLIDNAPRRVRFDAGEVARIDQGRVRLRDGGSKSAAAVVLAAGVHAPRLCPELPIRPKKGHLVITDRYPGLVRHQLIELGYVASAHASEGASVAFNVQPRPTGQLLIGSSRQFDVTDAAVDRTIVARMLQRAFEYLPGIGELNAIRTWTGLRAATPDSLPMIGAHPRRPGLWLAVGHEGLGVTLAPATAALLAAQMIGAQAPVDPAPYAPARFLPAS